MQPNREDECARIEAAGGKVINWDGYRVSGVLAVSRSIGTSIVGPFPPLQSITPNCSKIVSNSQQCPKFGI